MLTISIVSAPVANKIGMSCISIFFEIINALCSVSS